MAVVLAAVVVALRVAATAVLAPVVAAEVVPVAAPAPEEAVDAAAAATTTTPPQVPTTISGGNTGTQHPGNEILESIMMSHVSAVYKVTAHDSESESNNTQRDAHLLVDTGASCHLLCTNEYFTYFDNTFDPAATFLELADGSRHTNLIHGRGCASIPLYDVNGIQRRVLLDNALYVPSFKRNILSLYEAVKNNDIHFFLNNPGKEYMTTPEGHKFKINTTGKLYMLYSLTCSTVVSHTAAQWHRIMGHCNVPDILQLPGYVNNMRITDKSFSTCDICVQAKMKQTFNRAPDDRSTIPFHTIHIDLHGPLNEINENEYSYTFGAVDEFSGFVAVYLMRAKSDTTQAMKQFIADHTVYGQIRKVWTDNGTEFLSNDFKDIMLDKNIRHEKSCPYSPHQMGHIERCWGTLFAMARCILYDSKVPIHLWPYVVKTTAYIRNRCFSERLQLTPLEAASCRPNLAALHIFGAKVFGYMQFKRKLEPRATASIFVGYDDNSPSYLLYNPHTLKVSKVRCVTFTNDLYYNDAESDNSTPDHDAADAARDPLPGPPLTQQHPPQKPPADHSHTLLPPTLTPQTDTQVPVTYSEERRYPTRERNAITRFGVDNNVVDSDELDNVEYVNSLNVFSTIINIPSKYIEAIMSPDKDRWVRAMSEEVASLRQNNTYDLVKPPPGIKPVGGRWVFNVKNDPSGNRTFKARWVAQNYAQRMGIDYDQTYAPTPHMPSLRMLANISAQLNLIVHQMDVNNAYLNSEIDRPNVYMVQPLGFVDNPKLVCRLNKSLYGLKQSARLWNTTLKAGHTHLHA